MKRLIKKAMDKLKTRWTIWGIEFTNTILHAIVGAVVAMIGFIMPYISNGGLWVIAGIAFSVVTISWELAQRSRAIENALTPRMKDDLKRISAKTEPLTKDEEALLEIIEKRKRSAWNWADSIADIIAGNTGFYLVYLTIYYFMG